MTLGFMNKMDLIGLKGGLLAKVYEEFFYKYFMF